MAEPDLFVPLAIAYLVILGSVIIAIAAIHFRQQIRSLGSWPRIYRELDRKQRASVRSALRGGRAVDDPELTAVVVAGARWHIQLHRLTPWRLLSSPWWRRLSVALGGMQLADGMLDGWRAATNPDARTTMLVAKAVWLSIMGLLVIVSVPLDRRTIRRAEQAERANHKLLEDG